MTTSTTILATNAGMKGLALIIGLGGVAFRYWLGRRRFNRRNSVGIEIFRSYEHMRIIGLLEGFGWLIGNLMITGVILLLLMTYLKPVTPPHR